MMVGSVSDKMTLSFFMGFRAREDKNITTSSDLAKNYQRLKNLKFSHVLRVKFAICFLALCLLTFFVDDF